MAATQTVVTLSPEELAELVEKAVNVALDKRSGAKPAKKYLDTEEIAAHFNVHSSTVHGWVKEGCPVVTRGKLWRFVLAEVEAWFRGRKPGIRAVK